MERRKFTREFKLEAVRLIKDRGVSYVQASKTSACTCRSCVIGSGSSPTIRRMRSLATVR